MAPISSRACDIVNGSNWAFISQAPSGWTAACGDDAMKETAITLWPQEQSPSAAHALIYVTVSGKENDNLASFVQGEIARYRAEATDQEKPEFEPQPEVSPTRRLVHVANATGGRDELVEYIEGPTAYFIVVLTTESPVATKQYLAAYQAFLDSFSPASVSQSGG
jgi:hypothetical protein